MKNRAFPGSCDHIRVSRPSERGEDILQVKISEVDKEEYNQFDEYDNNKDELNYKENEK